MKIKGFSLKSGRNTLRGIVLKPNNSENLPLVIVSHGFASSMRDTFQYAKVFVDCGYAAICYDFCMSGSGISSGSSLSMSVLTEMQDLTEVLDYAKRLPFVNSSRISLAGCSQGGLVSALAAARREQDVERLFLYYPALCIPDDARRGHMITARFHPNNIPDKFFALFVHLSRKYAEDAMSLDPYKEICTFQKPVFIVHGIEDKLVSIDYSRRAQKEYADCRLIEVHGDHGFILKGFHASKKATTEYLNSIQ